MTKFINTELEPDLDLESELELESKYLTLNNLTFTLIIFLL